MPAPMSAPTVVLVHGAFAGSSSWDGVVERLHRHDVPVVAVANPLRSLSGDAQYVRDVVASIEGPVVLVGHSYGGGVVTEAASGNDDVVGLVFVAAFAPDHTESALELSGRFPGSTLGDTLTSYPVGDGTELAIRQDRFPEQFAADVDPGTAALMAATQRPVLEAALTEGLATQEPAWQHVPSWFVLAEEDRNIPAEAVRWMAGRAQARGLVEIPGASHAVAVSHPGEVADVVLAAVAAHLAVPAS
ncbi:alpha/beta fold hydrolase [Cellulomonas sp. PhB143]|uniref:alpha/beta fold hydrolase n=1 Tax=Cellulomonas sp. PhB143 TaxID=2485186 RepID=UPI000FBDE962|nr:alpha/beta hydrolase [Cellulomonas sp. PhB143]ROS75503.1 pimeloyl-ACP methyl ester carboxylesterase [Cellulomonas sp. PhB143]